MSSARAAGLALVLAAAVAATGCGGDGGGEFREQANAICADFDQRIAAIPTPAELADLEDSAGQIADLIEEGTRALRELGAPGELADAYADWLDLNDDAVENAREISAAAEAGDRARIAELAARAEQNEAEADALAEELELDECLIDEPEANAR